LLAESSQPRASVIYYRVHSLKKQKKNYGVPLVSRRLMMIFTARRQKAQSVFFWGGAAGVLMAWQLRNFTR
jgi:hypothetical protein